MIAPTAAAVVQGNNAEARGDVPHAWNASQMWSVPNSYPSSVTLLRSISYRSSAPPAAILLRQVDLRPEPIVVE
jgi:hypothetical protein